MSRNKDYISLINCTKWRKLREIKLKSNPLCELCTEQKKTVLAEEIHHIQSIEDGINYTDMEQRTYDYDNLQSLCHECHKNIHIRKKLQNKKTQTEINKKKTDSFMDRFFGDKTE